jgi:hypothetical protein
MIIDAIWNWLDTVYGAAEPDLLNELNAADRQEA